MKKLLRFISPYKLIAFLGITTKLLEGLLELLLPLIMADIINNAFTSNTSYISTRINVMVGIVTVGFLLAFVCQRSAAYVGANFGHDVRSAVNKNINSMSYSNLNSLKRGKLLNSLTSDIAHTQTSVSIFIRLATRTPFITVGSLLMAFTISKEISIIFLAIIPITIFILYKIMKKSINLHKITLKSLDSITKSTEENLVGARVFRAYNKGFSEVAEFDNKTSDYANKSMKTLKVLALSSPLSSLVVNIGVAFVVLIGGHYVHIGNLLPGDITALTTYLIQILVSLTILANLGIVFTKAESSASRINEILQTTSEIVEKEDYLVDMSNIEPSLSFDNVSFQYDNTSTKAIDNVSFDIEPSSWIGIIGVTGSAKSTLINLIPRFYDTSSGSISIGGVDIRDLSLKSLRKYVGVVPQKSNIFNMSIYDNIKFGSNCNDELVKLSAHVADCDEFIEKKSNQYDEMIVASGKNLSGGQQQRLSIARTLARQPKILVLDDSLSALDNKTEHTVVTRLKENFADTTTLIISQKISSIKYCDKILVLKNGELADFGTHSELISRCDEYKNIYNSQNGGVK